MFHDDSWKTIYFGMKRSKVKVTSHKYTVGVSLCILTRAGFFQFLEQYINLHELSLSTMTVLWTKMISDDVY